MQTFFLFFFFCRLNAICWLRRVFLTVSISHCFSFSISFSSWHPKNRITCLLSVPLVCLLFPYSRFLLHFPYPRITDTALTLFSVESQRGFDLIHRIPVYIPVYIPLKLRLCALFLMIGFNSLTIFVFLAGYRSEGIPSEDAECFLCILS